MRSVARKRGKWLCWSAPSPGTVKMNVDGSSKNHQGACGGVLRSSSGAFLGGFCSPTSEEDIFLAELEGILQGVRFCKRIGGL